MVDKNGVKIKPGQIVKINNKRGDCVYTGIVEDVDGELKIKHTDKRNKGKYSRVSTWINAIWWSNDVPENFIEVID